jgi:hypothetical protein
MTKLGELNPNRFYCECGMTTRETPHTCIDSRLSKVDHLPLVGILLMCLAVVVGGLVLAVEVWK